MALGGGALMIWCCPSCRGDLVANAAHLECGPCERQFPFVCEIPDLRLKAPTWINFETDLRRALAIDDIASAKGIETAIYNVFRNSRKFSHEKSTYRVKQVYASIEKCTDQLKTWLAATIEFGPAMDLGCGPGPLSAAAASQGRQIAAVDVSIEWLTVAKHLVRAYGGEPQLAAGLAEALPITSHSLGALISLDVIEHVGDQRKYMSEIARVLAPNGRFAISTPNRFSLSPEPHVGVWGVGYLPVPLQAPWVRLASGNQYEYTRLLSVKETARLIEDAGMADFEIVFPPISDEEIAIFSPLKAKLAQCYNRIIRNSFIKLLAPYFGAYYRVQGCAAKARATAH
jgi:2-polyprenyl-3-methyl-5-hydroxy-6-metoxy-1,4-benzoquinol methylase